MKVSLLGLIFCMRLDRRKDIQCIESACSVLLAELKARVLAPPQEKQGNQEHKTNTHNKDILFAFNDARREKLNSVQEFVEVEPWLLLIFLTCLHNQLKFNYKFL